MARRIARIAAVCALVGGSVACVQLGFDERSLYVQLGERPGIDRLVDRLLRELAADDRVAEHFRGVDIGRLREQFAVHLCQLAGGPCRYEGAPIREVHRGMGITQAEFNAVVEDLIDAMECLHVPTPTQNELLALLAPFRGDVVESRWHRR